MDKPATNRSGRQPPPPSSAAGLPAPRFSLGALFAAIGVVALGLSVWKAVGPVVGVSLLLLLMAVVAHVAGNALGTRLRDRGTQHALAGWKDDTSTGGSPAARPRAQPVAPHHFAPVTRLSQRTSLGWCPLVVTVLGGIAGAIAGGLLLQRSSPESATLSTLAVGATASGVLAALFSYWLFSLLQVFLGAWWQAHRHGR
jgi:hypothetical protein